MPLTIFDHDSLAVYESVADPSGPHQFGGDPKRVGLTFQQIKREVHLVALLEADDSTRAIIPDGLTRLPLCYGFRFVSIGEDFEYLVKGDSRVEILPDTASAGNDFIDSIIWWAVTLFLRIIGVIKFDHGHQYDASFPYEDHPDVLPQSKFRFVRQPYDATNADDALRLQGVFGLGHLSPDELQRAANIGVSNPGCISDPDWYDGTNIAKVMVYGRSPFYQDVPSTWCNNPRCDSGDLENTVKVIAIFVADDDIVWGSGGPQMIYTLCDRCQCITASNQA